MILFTIIVASIVVSGILAILCSAILGIFCILCIMQMAMISSREKVVMSYISLVVTKMVLALIGGKDCLIIY